MQDSTQATIIFTLLILLTCILIAWVYELKGYRKKIVYENDISIDTYSFAVKIIHAEKMHVFAKRRNFYTVQIIGDKVLPNVFLDAHYNDRYLYATEYIAYEQNQRISLEGDFDKHFQLYAPENLRNEVLAFITPDLMTILKDKLRVGDLLIRGRTITFNSNVTLDIDDTLNGLHTLLLKVVRQYKLSNTDKEIKFSNNVLRGSTVFESIKFRSRLISTKTALYWVLYIFPLLIFIIMFFVITGENNTANITDFFIGILCSLLISTVVVLILEADDRGFIDLSRLR